MQSEYENEQKFEGFNLQIINLEVQDIITTSGPLDGDGETGGGEFPF